MIFIRNGGKLCFATLRDGDGTELQAMLSLDKVGAEALEEWKRVVDLGDLVGVTGEVITSRRGELSVLADTWAMSAKALRPLPVAHKPLSEETRVRQRYVDLIVRPQARDMVRTRATVVRSLRESLFRRNYLEVETPMLQLLHGGAAARPFVTHSNALDIDLYLRIAPELFLKRAVVGGIERVFEINRNFRNEGMDSSHSPEFAMLEAYQAYADYNVMQEQVREWIQEAAIAVAGSHVVTHYDGTEFDLGGEWASITLFGALSEALGEEVTVAYRSRTTSAVRGKARPIRRPEVGSRQARRGALRGSGAARPAGADLRARLPGGDVPADPGPPGNAGTDREVGSVRPRLRARHRLFRAGRPGGAAGAADRPGVARGRWRSGGDACWTRISFGPWSTECRRPVAWEWESTGC